MKVRILDGVSATSSAPIMRALGKITTVAKADFIDGEITTIGDGTNTVIFEWDVAGDGVTAGRTAVDISGSTSADDTATVLNTAINASVLEITGTRAGTGIIRLRADKWGTDQNVTITDDVADGSFAVTGMVSGSLSGVYLWRQHASDGKLPPRTNKCLLRLSAIVDDGTVGVIKIRLWGADGETMEMAPIGVGVDATKGTIDDGSDMAETGTDIIEHTEILNNVGAFDYIYGEVVTATNIASANLDLIPILEPVLR